MMRTSVTLLLALGAAAEVPQWVAKKPSPSFNMPSIESVFKPVLSLQRKLAQQKSDSRRLQAIMSDACKNACPGAADMFKAMMEMAMEATETEGETTPAPDGGMAMMTKMCDHADAMMCTAKTAACKEEGDTSDGSGTEMVGCMCKCPKLATLGENADSSKVCSDLSGTFGCMLSESACAAMAAQSGTDMTTMQLGCDYNEKGCEDKQNQMQTCMGDDMAVFGANNCDADIAANAEKCCPAGKKMIGCMGADCYALSLAMQKKAADSGNADAKKSMKTTEETRAACPDAGIPSASAIESKLAAAAAASDGGGAADFAAPGQAVSTLAMAAATIALFA